MIEIILSIVVACILVVLTANVEIAAAIESTPSADATLKSTDVVNIENFGAHSITETGYETFDSSSAINKAIWYAKTNNISSVDFGSGKYYAKNVFLESNITYFSTEDAELIASPNIQTWNSVLNCWKVNNITIRGLTINGNWDVVPGDINSGSQLIGLTGSNNILIENCYLYHNQFLGILMQNDCNYITIRNNKICDTDAGIIATNGPSNHITIDNNIIYGEKITRSEPISIYNNNSTGLSNYITIINNTVYGKPSASGIEVMNSSNVLIKGNTSYGCYTGIIVGIDAVMTGTKVTPSENITITDNYIHDCQMGIVAEMNDSTISNNTVKDIKGLGIQVMTKNITTPISNTTIIGNTITNINSAGAYEPAIRLTKTSNCIIDNNIVSDTRTPVLHYYAIIVADSKSTDNIVRNNITLGPVTKWGYQIWINGANNTTLINNIGTICDKGIATNLINNKTN